MMFLFCQIDFGDSKMLTEEEVKRVSDYRSSSVSSFSGLFKAANDRDAFKLQRQGTFVGTALYVAPEMLEYNNSGRFTDLWALGCILYQMLVGKTPFDAETKDSVFQKVLDRRLKFPMDLDKDAVNLIDRLLDYIPENRIGMKSKNPFDAYSEIKDHPYFSDIEW